MRCYTVTIEGVTTEIAVTPSPFPHILVGNTGKSKGQKVPLGNRDFPRAPKALTEIGVIWTKKSGRPLITSQPQEGCLLYLSIPVGSDGRQNKVTWKSQSAEGGLLQLVKGKEPVASGPWSGVTRDFLVPVRTNEISLVAMGHHYIRDGHVSRDFDYLMAIHRPCSVTVERDGFCRYSPRVIELHWDGKGLK